MSAKPTKPAVFTGSQLSNLSGLQGLAEGVQDFELQEEIRNFRKDVGNGRYASKQELDAEYQRLNSEPRVLNRGNPALAFPKAPLVSEAPQKFEAPTTAHVTAELNSERRALLEEKMIRASVEGDQLLVGKLSKLVQESEEGKIPEAELEGRFQGLRTAPIEPGRTSDGQVGQQDEAGNPVASPVTIEDRPEDPNIQEITSEIVDPEADARLENETAHEAWKKQTSLIYLDVRGAFYQVSLADKPTAGFYAIEELNEFLENYRGEAEQVQPILIQSVETTQSDIVGMVNCLENVKVVYTFGQNLGNVGIVGEILLGPLGGNVLGTESSGVRQLMNFFEKYRASNWRDAVKVSCLGESFFVYLTGLRLLRVDPDLHIMPFQLTGILLDLNREKINPASKVVTKRQGLEVALGVFAPTERSADQTGVGGSSNAQAKPGEAKAGVAGNERAGVLHLSVNADEQSAIEQLNTEASTPRLLTSPDPSLPFVLLSQPQSKFVAPESAGVNTTSFAENVGVGGAGFNSRNQPGILAGLAGPAPASFDFTMPVAAPDYVGQAITRKEIQEKSDRMSRLQGGYEKAFDASSVDVKSPLTREDRAAATQAANLWKVATGSKPEVASQFMDRKGISEVEHPNMVRLRAIEREADKFAEDKGFTVVSVPASGIGAAPQINIVRNSETTEAARNAVLARRRKESLALISEMEADQQRLINEDAIVDSRIKMTDTDQLRRKYGAGAK